MTNNNENLFNWHEIKTRIQTIIAFFPQFMKNPYEGIKRVPAWDWMTIVLLEVLVAALTRVLEGLLGRSLLTMVGGLIVGPIMGVLVALFIAGGVYYLCMFMLKTELDFKKLATVVILAETPGKLILIFSPFARPIFLLSVAISSFLLIVGLTENFMLDKKKVTRIVGGLAILFVLFWTYNLVVDFRSSRIKVRDYTSESLDQLDKELNENK